MPDKDKLLKNAARFQRNGRAGDALKVMILAGEAKSIRDVDGWRGRC